MNTLASATVDFIAPPKWCAVVFMPVVAEKSAMRLNKTIALPIVMSLVALTFPKDGFTRSRDPEKRTPSLATCESREDCAQKALAIRNMWEEHKFHVDSVDLLTFEDINGLAPDTISFTHELEPTVIVLKESGWSMSNVIERIQRLSEILSQCSIRVSSATFISASTPQGKSDFKESQSKRLAKSAPDSAAMPILFYVRIFTDWPTTAYSFLAGPAVGTAWFNAEETKFSDVNLMRDGIPEDPISDEAHELAHILLRADHIKEEGVLNILAPSERWLTNDISPNQCEEMKKSPLLKSRSKM